MRGVHLLHSLFEKSQMRKDNDNRPSTAMNFEISVDIGSVYRQHKWVQRKCWKSKVSTYFRDTLQCFPCFDNMRWPNMPPFSIYDNEESPVTYSQVLFLQWPAQRKLVSCKCFLRLLSAHCQLKYNFYLKVSILVEELRHFCYKMTNILIKICHTHPDFANFHRDILIAIILKVCIR